jgi:murein DD-endopeptidase MepM/ murein hydrolase activator NlpD
MFSRLRNLFFYILIFTPLLLPFPLSIGLASDINVKFIPETLFPGDAFLVEVKAPEFPSGVFDSSPLYFYQVSNGLYYAISSIRVNLKPGKYQLFISTGTSSNKYIVEVHEKRFPLQKLTLQPNKVFLSPENEVRVKKENIKLLSLWNKVTKPLWEGKFIPPLNTSISTQFGVVRIINKKKKSIHRGIDYRASLGKPIRAINSGIVVLADELFYGGNTLIINHGAGIYSIYMHLSKFMVKVGQSVRKRDIIGFAGSTGRVTGPHLHLSIKVQGKSVNPESIFALPLTPPFRDIKALHNNY